MQVLETVVEKGAFPTVRFLGEGGESISVSLPFETAMDDEQLVAHAKVMLLHAAQFDEAGQGELADGSLTEPAENPVSYTLEYQDKGEVRNMTGLSFPTVEALTAECIRSATDLWQDALSRGDAPLGWAVRARDPNGEIVASVDYEDVRDPANGDPPSVVEGLVSGPD